VWYGYKIIIVERPRIGGGTTRGFRFSKGSMAALALPAERIMDQLYEEWADVIQSRWLNVQDL
jgi:hypothetical protein